LDGAIFRTADGADGADMEPDQPHLRLTQAWIGPLFEPQMAQMSADMESHRNYLRSSAKSAVKPSLDRATFRTADGADGRRYGIPQRLSAPICEICGSNTLGWGHFPNLRWRRCPQI
jgi:hypothetical protein